MSLFVVIFAILLMSVVTIGFLRIMTNDQSKASSNDLAQSAYDSSQAGVEDAKRALIWYTQKCTGTATPDTKCATFVSNLSSCNLSLRTAGVISVADSGTGTDEVKVQQSTNVDASGNSIDSALNQAYTCVKMTLDTDDYVGALTNNQTVVVPIVTTGALPTSLTIEWFGRDDTSDTTGKVSVTAPTTPPQKLLSTWPANRPPVVRAQYMQVGNSFRLSDFDSTAAGGKSDTNTLFLYPATNGVTSAVMTDRDVRRSPTGNVTPAATNSVPLLSKCATTVAAGGYACKITLQLPAPVSGTAKAAYLRLTSMYAATHFRVTLAGGVKFKNVQPIVDATGRANDVFRRVQSRIEYTTFPYPDAAVDVTGNFCKDFGVTDKDYYKGSCTP